jgi:hypothetical protein
MRLPRSLDHPKWTIGFMVGVALVVWGIFIWRANTSANTSFKLCQAINALIVPQVYAAHTKSTVAYQYYANHRVALKRLDKFVNDLPC